MVRHGCTGEEAVVECMELERENRVPVEGAITGADGGADDWFAPATRTAMVGGALLMPALAAVSTVTIPLPLPGLVTHPLLVLGGLAAALLLNLLEVVRLEVAAGEGRVEARLEFLGRDRLPNVAIIAVALLVIADRVLEQVGRLGAMIPPGPG